MGYPHDQLETPWKPPQVVLRTSKGGDATPVVRHRLRGAAQIRRRPGHIVLGDLQTPHDLGGFTGPKCLGNSSRNQGKTHGKRMMNYDELMKNWKKTGKHIFSESDENDMNMGRNRNKNEEIGEVNRKLREFTKNNAEKHREFHLKM